MSLTTAPTEKPKGTQVEVYAQQVMGDEDRANTMLRALPKHVPAHRFTRNLVNLLMQKPEMMHYDPRLVYREVSKAAALGLLLDPQLGEAYIVPVWNGKRKCTEPQLRTGYRGIMKLGRQSGEIANLYPGEVCENDFFDADEGTEKRLIHKPDYTKPRGEPVCYYAVVLYKDGTKDFDVMGIPAIHKIRDKSDGWKAFTAGKISSTPWASDEGEMCKKTVLRRLCKRIPQSPDLQDALALETDMGQARPVIDLVPQQPRPAQSSISSRLDAFAEADEPHDAETGELPDEAAAAGDPAPAAQEGAAPSADTAISDDDGAAPSTDPKTSEAWDKGHAARVSNMPKEVPKSLQGKGRQAEAQAFLRGWEMANDEIQAEEQGGTV